MRLFPTYTGGSPEEKPEALKKALQRGDIPTDEEFIQKVDLLILSLIHIFLLRPTCISVLPEDALAARVGALVTVFKSQPELEICLLYTSSLPITAAIRSHCIPG